MARKLTRQLRLLVFVLGLIVARFVFAQSVTLPNPLGSQSTLNSVVSIITNFLIYIAAPLTAVMVLVGGFQMIVSGGNPEKISQGRKTLIWAAIGFAVVLLAGSVTSIIKSILSS